MGGHVAESFRKSDCSELSDPRSGSRYNGPVPVYFRAKCLKARAGPLLATRALGCHALWTNGFATRTDGEVTRAFVEIIDVANGPKGI